MAVPKLNTKLAPALTFQIKNFIYGETESHKTLSTNDNENQLYILYCAEGERTTFCYVLIYYLYNIYLICRRHEHLSPITYPFQ